MSTNASNQQPAKPGYRLVLGVQEDIHFGWVWEEPYLSATAESDESVVQQLHQKLMTELKRREAAGLVFKFRPPPPLPAANKTADLKFSAPRMITQLTERVADDLARAERPVVICSVDQWRDTHAVERTQTATLPLGAGEAEVKQHVQRWLELLCQAKWSDAMTWIPASDALLPRSDFPQPQKPYSAELLQADLEQSSDKSPQSFVLKEISIRSVAGDPTECLPRAVGYGVGHPRFNVLLEFVETTQERNFEALMTAYSGPTGDLLTLNQLNNH